MVPSRESSPTLHTGQHIQLGTSDDNMNDETEGPLSFWVRAAYDYQSTDDSLLSFSRGDIIEVLGMLPSGWWDGLIGNERGWLPSNFVVTISDAEAEAELTHTADAALPDFVRHLWLPEVQPNGQIVYVNGAGQRRTDLPDADTDDMMPRPTRGRANTSSLSRSASVRRTGTPEPWLKRLNDDGHTFYENTVTGAIMRSRPDASTQHSQASSTSELGLRSRNRAPKPATDQADTKPHIDPEEVQRRLAPSDPDTIQSLVSVVKQAISQCMAIQDHALRAPIVAKVVIAVRNLLYVSGTMAPAPEVLSPLVSHFEPRESELPQAHLNQYRGKVIATLSELVLGARAADSNQDDIKAQSYVAIDAAELERAVDLFAAEAHDGPIHRTLRGVFSPTHVGRGAPGGGIGGQWRGSGFVERVPRDLTPETCDQLRILGGELESALVCVQQGVSSVKETNPDGNDVSTIITRGRAAIATLCAFLNAAEELDVAAKVGKDIETRRGLVRKAVPDQSPGCVKSRAEVERTSGQDELGRAGRVGSQDQLGRIGSREALGRLSRPASRDKLGRMNGQEQPNVSRQPYEDRLAPVASPLSLSRPGSRNKLTVSRPGSRDRLAQSPSFSAKQLDTSWGVRKAVRRLEVAKQALYDAGMTLLFASQAVHVGDLCGAGFVPPGGTVCGVDANSLSLVSHAVTTIRENQRQMIDLLDVLAKTDSPDSYVSGETKRDTPMSSNYSLSYHGTDTGVNSRADTYPSSIRFPVDHLATSYGGGSSVFGDSIYGSAFGVGRERVDSTALGRSRPDDSLDVLGDQEDELGSRGPPRVNKIRKLLGDDPAAEFAKKGGAIPPAQIVDTTPWYLKPTYDDPSQIQIDTDDGVRGGTLPALIERLVMHDQLDSTFIDAFLMTYTSFMTTKELFRLLVERFRIQPPDGLAPAELDDWIEKKQKPARVRVVNVFRKMLLLYDSSIDENSYILEYIKSFAHRIVYDVTPAELLTKIVYRVQEQGGIPRRRY
ncbi:unnamed protein product [Rhizoctonia solani]|uniref:SH3 domain-containing protein n=1 Tax=Rhizoctonia solani TaxID=456999 RepID=A0A8H3HGX7_9AGAM|nr:unnamed protein product [Rhizoctonia solani]